MTKYSREHITNNGRATFYACIWPDLQKAAHDCGWALGLHGSLSSDMDIMAMPWTEDCKDIEDLLKAICDLFTGNMWNEQNIKPFIGKPHNRIVYNFTIFADFYLDISIIVPSLINFK